jgi:hypothetical protein
MNVKKEFLENGAIRLHEFGYDYFDDPRLKGGNSYFLRKNVEGVVFTFIGFKRYSYAKQLDVGEPEPKRFDFTMFRNSGNFPEVDLVSNDKNYFQTINVTLPYFLWTILNLRIYEGPYHVWEYSNQQEFVAELNDAVEKLIFYGLPWLEDPNSKYP